MSATTMTEVNASHVVMVSHPDVVADVIRTAVATTVPAMRRAPHEHPRG